jgi:hypothetical protein
VWLPEISSKARIVAPVPGDGHAASLYRKDLSLSIRRWE